MKVLDYSLDKEQLNIVKDNSKYLLVIAGAGSGKTLTIVGKIKYLVNTKRIKQEEIIAISFTNNACNSLKDKLNKENLSDVLVYTFHKLSLNILNNKYQVTDNETLNNIVHNFLYIDILESEYHMYLLLKCFNKIVINDIKKMYLKLLNTKEIESLEKLIITYIHQFKCNNYNIYDFKDMLNKIKSINYFKYKKEKILLTIIINIYIRYETYLKDNNELDFDDLIINATKEVKNYNKRIKYIIIDEYQDISYIRLLLVKALINKTNSKLMCVGDDYQSIYKFSGSNINLFLKFKDIFSNGKILFLNNTYRNSKELVDIANKFICKNKLQIKKEINSSKRLINPIKIVYYNDLNKELRKLINIINTNILILGRNNKDINLIDKDILNDRVKYMTIHKSKGLEEDNVIIINLINDTLGFPNKIKNNKILRTVIDYEDSFLYSEERRLFYVSLTRTKNYVYLLVPKYKESIFISEIKKSTNVDFFN